MRWFITSTVLLGILTILLIYCNIVLLTYHKPNISERPFDAALIHAPIRMFLILPLSLMLPYSLLYVHLAPFVLTSFANISQYNIRTYLAKRG